LLVEGTIVISRARQAVLEKQAEVAKALAHPLRVAIVGLLKDGEQCVCDIAEHVGAERSNVSRHLSVMVGAGVLGWRKDGLKVFYELRTSCVLKFLGCIDEVLREKTARDAALLKALG
jgi:ArsR family transcriptional regulator, arsenate/arsenite/antimonite-responsive transcriptional repressor